VQWMDYCAEASKVDRRARARVCVIQSRH
jgi:hypothetical protein